MKSHMRLLLLQFVDYITNILHLMNFSVLQYDPNIIVRFIYAILVNFYDLHLNFSKHDGKYKGYPDPFIYIFCFFY